MSLWSGRDFRLVWFGQTLSAFGNGVSRLAYPLPVPGMTGSTAALSSAR